MKASTAQILNKPITKAILSIIIGMLVAAIFLAAAGFDPVTSFGALFYGALGKPKYISNVIIKATPIILTGVGVAFAFRTGLFNIGAEGQYIAGTIFAVMAGYIFNLPPVLEIPLIILAGTAAGALVGALIGWLKAKFGIHEVITSIMFNWIALYFNNYICATKFFHAPNSTSTYPIHPSGYTMILPNWKMSPEGLETLRPIPWLYNTLVKTDVNIGILVAIASAIFISWLLRRTWTGFEMRAVGFNPDASKFTGINMERNIVLSMLISGALCGLAGALIITGTTPHAISTLAAFENYGFNGLSVAVIAGSSPIGCIFAGLLFSGLLYGAQTVQQVVGAPSDIINIMIGTIVFAMALSAIMPVFIEKFQKRGVKHVK